MYTIKFINLNINSFFETDDSIREALSEILIEAGLTDPAKPNKPIENISDKLMLEISGQIPDVLFIIERKETSETDTIVTTYYRRQTGTVSSRAITQHLSRSFERTIY